jgi:sugar transferase (PEP-CTERM/EpsH1 system associated)
MFQYLDVPGLRGVRTVVDLVDVDSQKFLDYAHAASFWKAWLYRLEGQRLRTLEKTIAQRASAISFVSEAEADIYRGFCPNDKTLGIANGVDLDYFQPQTGQAVDNRCIFVGALDYPPNIDAMLWFCREVWPRVRSELPDATLSIVGRNPTLAVRELSAVAGVEVVGSVPDVRPHMAAASVAIAPLRIARGIQNKVLEAMAMALPVIVSPGALEGLALEPGKHVLLAETAEQWVHAVTRLCQDRATAAKLGSIGREFVESAHDWSTCLNSLDDVLELNSTSRTSAALATSMP